MSEIKLFKISGAAAAEIPGEALALEKSLQVLIEANLETFLGVRFLASEKTTGKTHAGRIDTLGVDENHLPLIIEYKRATNENVINQGLFYLDWLLDHRADFKLLMIEKYGVEEANQVDWTGPRLICIAADFTRYDVHAVQQIERNIELVRYRKFGSEMLALELIHKVTAAEPAAPADGADQKPKAKVAEWTVKQGIDDLDQPLRDIYEGLKAFLTSLGDDVTIKTTKLYVAFRRIKNFATITVGKSAISVYLKLDPQTVSLEDGFTRDVSSIGHWGTGDLEVTIKTANDFEKAKALLQKAYMNS